MVIIATHIALIWTHTVIIISINSMHMPMNIVIICTNILITRCHDYMNDCRDNTNTYRDNLNTYRNHINQLCYTHVWKKVLPLSHKTYFLLHAILHARLKLVALTPLAQNKNILPRALRRSLFGSVSLEILSFTSAAALVMLVGLVVRGQTL